MTTKRFGPYTVELSREEDLLLPDRMAINAATLVYLADQGRLTLHPWKGTGRHGRDLGSVRNRFRVTHVENRHA